MAGNRRLAAIVFTDISGYTSLSQTDERAARGLIQEQDRLVRPLLEIHRGRLVKMIGDGLLLEFPNALDAVSCAVDLQRHIQERNARQPPPELRVRIGIHLGDIEEAGPDILGDAVNIASRIEPLAEPGGICLSSQVYDQVHNKVSVRLEKLGPQNLKGVRESVGVYRVVLPRTGEEALPAGSFSHRLAVLPLTNMSPDPNDEYFADGLTEEIISAVSKVPALGVISRTSVMRYKSQTKPMAEIGHELGASSVLEGSVRKVGNRVRIAVQLIDAVADRHLWAENYERSLDDIFAIQSEIAQQVAKALEIRLLDPEKGQITKAPTDVTEANLLYMKGVFHAQRLTKAELETAIGFFEKAVQRDPRYARAYAAMAAAYGTLGIWEMIPAPEAYTKVERAARKALELDASLAEPHLSLYGVRFYHSRDFKGARESLERAIALNRNLPRAHNYAGYVYIILEQPERAITEARRAIELDPFSAATVQFSANVMLEAGRPELAVPLAEKGVELDPVGSWGHGTLGLAYIQLGKLEEGVEEVRKAVELSAKTNPPELADLAYALSRAGRIGEAREIIAELLENHQKRGTGSAAIACAYASVGDADRAFEWLERAFEEGSGYASLFMLDLGFRTLSTDPRFQKFLERAGVAPNR